MNNQFNFLNNKVADNEKYNPDVLNDFNKLLQNRDNQNFTISNKTYKPIINNTPTIINNVKDLQINIDKSNNDIKNKLNELSQKRNYDDQIVKNRYNNNNKNKFEQDFKYRNVEICKISSSIKDNNNYNNLKKDTNSYYEIQKKKIDEDKQRYNNIINSILDDGLLN